jgi:hypothetical protein
MGFIRSYRGPERSYYVVFDRATLALGPVAHRKTEPTTPIYERGTYQTTRETDLVLQISYMRGVKTPEYYLRTINSDGTMSKVHDNCPADMLEILLSMHPWISSWATLPKRNINNSLPIEIAPEENDLAFINRTRRLRALMLEFGLSFPAERFAYQGAKVDLIPGNWEEHFGLPPDRYREFINTSAKTKRLVTWYGSVGRAPVVKLKFAPTYMFEDRGERVAGTVGLGDHANYKYLIRSQTISKNGKTMGETLQVVKSPLWKEQLNPDYPVDMIDTVEGYNQMVNYAGKGE